MRKQIDLVKLRNAWRDKGFTDKEICKLIGMNPNSMTKKFNNTHNPTLKANDFVTILDAIQSPMDMFIKKGE